MSGEDFERSVFVNCPYSPDYREMQRAMIFTLMRLGFTPHLAAQISDSGQPRMEKIRRQIRECRHSVHDLSLVISGKKGEHARMNMPYELGLDRGARWYGPAPLDRKTTLVLERKRDSVKKALSDHAGFDLRTHEGQVTLMMHEVRSHFYSHFPKPQGAKAVPCPSHEELTKDWTAFAAWLQQRPDGSLRPESEIKEMEVAEFKDNVREWLEAERSPQTSPSPAYDLIRAHVEECYDGFVQQAVTPWALFGTSHGVAIDLPDGRAIRYSGLAFSGTPRQVFWETMPNAFIQDIAKKAFEWTRKLCREEKLPTEIPISETAMFLTGGLSRCLSKMIEIDQRLRGKGFPDTVQPHDPVNERLSLERIIQTRHKAEKRLAGK